MFFALVSTYTVTIKVPEVTHVRRSLFLPDVNSIDWHLSKTLQQFSWTHVANVAGVVL
jgi:hypothetical protein